MEQISLPADSAGFIRRECVRCRRQFKTHPAAQDAIAIQRYLHRTLPLANEHELLGHAGMTCFYCGHRAAMEEWLTGAQQAFLQRVGRVLLQQVRFEQLAHVAQALSDNPRPTMTARPGSLPPPMSPEPDDMRRFFLPCCGDEVKAATGWTQAYFCPRCGTEHHDGMPRVKPQLQMMRE